MGNIGLPKIIITRAWYIWLERRQSTHGQNIQTPHRSVVSIGVLAKKNWRAKKKPIEKESWSCPLEGCFKI
jgi:hypothetical protein